MKKILTLAILLLILYPLLPMVYDNAASAQSWTLENGSYWMPNLDVTSTNEKCETCGHVYDPEEGHTCTFKCEYCGEEVTDMEAHYKRSLSCGNAAGGGKNDEDGADEELCGITGNMNDGYNIPNVTVIGNRSSNSGLWSIEIYCGGGTFSYGNSNSTEEINTEEKLHEPQQGNSASSNTVDNHRCPCMVTVNSRFYWTLIDNNPEWDELNDRYDGLTDGLKRHLAFPETIQQGNNGTCAAALIQKYLAENRPDQYMECVKELAKTGRYEPWGLEIPAGSNLSGITDFELRYENVDYENNKSMGINYTADDALMQTAIQNWADNNDFIKYAYNRMTGYVYSPLTDYGESGGMTAYDRTDFFYKNFPLDIAHYYNKTSYDDISTIMDSYNTDNYTIMAGVYMKYNGQGYYFGNTNEDDSHALEVIGKDSGHTVFWSYGKQGTTIGEKDMFNNILILRKTDYAKQEKSTRKELKCECPHCTNTNCDVCM